MVDYAHNTPRTGPQGYPPSVPISVYRDLAAELQAAQAMLNNLSAENQQLAQENQILRQEIAKTVQSVLHLQQFIDHYATNNYRQPPRYSGDMRREPRRPVNQPRPRQRVPRPRPRAAPPVMEVSSAMPEPMFIEEQEVHYYSSSEVEPSEVNGWWLVFAILFIILTAFGAGYLIVRPLFENQRR